MIKVKVCLMITRDFVCSEFLEYVEEFTSVNNHRLSLKFTNVSTRSDVIQMQWRSVRGDKVDSVSPNNSSIK